MGAQDARRYRLRIAIHDYAGHAFPVELSRGLASRGHDVLHVFSSSFLGPQGKLQRQDGDPANLYLEPIVLAQQVQKDNYLKRRQADIAHGKLAADCIQAFKPDVILSGNGPIDAQSLILRMAEKARIPFVFWVQDLIGQAALRILGPKVPVLGNLVGQAYIRFEQNLFRRSHRLVVISEDFKPWLPPEVLSKTEVVENWAPIKELPCLAKNNDWSQKHGLANRPVFLYSGTLGKKHDPSLLSGLAELKIAEVVVISEGEKMEWLKATKLEKKLDNLLLLPFQPFEVLPEILATADILVAILEPDAGVFSVPSKVLSYLCAGRPLLLSVPTENLAARVVTANSAGVVVAPGDTKQFLNEAAKLMQDQDLRKSMGENARKYSERAFNLSAITDRFEQILSP